MSRDRDRGLSALCHRLRDWTTTCTSGPTTVNMDGGHLHPPRDQYLQRRRSDKLISPTCSQVRDAWADGLRATGPRSPSRGRSSTTAKAQAARDPHRHGHAVRRRAWRASACRSRCPPTRRRTSTPASPTTPTATSGSTPRACPTRFRGEYAGYDSDPRRLGRRDQQRGRRLRNRRLPERTSAMSRRSSPTSRPRSPTTEANYTAHRRGRAQRASPSTSIIHGPVTGRPTRSRCVTPSSRSTRKPTQIAQHRDRARPRGLSTDVVDPDASEL